MEGVPSPTGFPGVQLYEYDGVPPVGATVAVPSQLPLQTTLVNDPGTANTAGCATTMVVLPVQPLESITVTVYVPAHKFKAVSLVPAPPVQE